MVVQNGDEIMTGMIKNSLLSGKVKAAGTVRSILVGMLLLLGLALQLPAETVGLWKMDYSETTGFNYRSLVNPAHDLLPIASVTSGTSAGWELPPNPDRSFVPLDSLFDTPISPDDTNAWHHLALVYEHDAISANRGVWELF